MISVMIVDDDPFVSGSFSVARATKPEPKNRSRTESKRESADYYVGLLLFSECLFVPWFYFPNAGE